METQKAIESIGHVDCLVNNAGIAILEPFLETKVENLQSTLDVNVKQVFVVSQIIARSMIKHGKGGSIVNVSSQVSISTTRSERTYC